MPDNTIDASPTKEFFISMLVKDIVLSRAILDLCDNCVDGARRLRPSENFQGLHIRIELSEHHFRIADNCGGIDSIVAREYAFRFGRPKQMKPTAHSVGQFGVGMKRSLFKIGTSFRIESRAKNSHFVINENVNEWKARQDWTFQFKSIEEGLENQPEELQGTTLVIDKLHDNTTIGYREVFSLLQTFSHVWRSRAVAEYLETNQSNFGHSLKTIA